MHAIIVVPRLHISIKEKKHQGKEAPDQLSTKIKSEKDWI
jgi:hypothetical protein